MKYRLKNFSSLIANFISFFLCKKKIFYRENIHYAYNFYGADLYVIVYAEAYLEPSRTSTVVLLWENYIKALL